MIFVEHDYLKTENSLLKYENNNLYQQLYNYEKVDSLRCIQLDHWEAMNVEKQRQLDVYNKQLAKEKRKKLGWQIGGITVSVGLILFLIFK